jgi:hypothetical protein
MTEAAKRVAGILSAIQYKDWKLRIVTENDALYLRWLAPVTCVKTGRRVTLTSSKWLLPDGITESELVQTAFRAAMSVEEHECRENFTYCGKRVLNPHINVHRLLAICDDEDARAGA